MNIAKSSPSNKPRIEGPFTSTSRPVSANTRAGKRSSTPSMPLKPGDTIRGFRGGVYKLKRMIGKGGFAHVFSAIVKEAPKTNPKVSSCSVRVGTTVIVKTPKIDLGRDPQRTSDFVGMVNRSLEHEIRVSSKLRKLKCVAHTLDWGHSQVKLKDGTVVSPYFVVQQYIDGPRLDAYLTDRFAETNFPSKGIQTSAEWFKLAKSLARTVKSVHQQGVCHQDIWPPNILMRDHNPCLIDFGEAAMRLTSSLPWTSGVEPHPYMAPEVRRGAKWPSRRADLYSLGGVLFFLAAGQAPPFRLPKNNDKLKLKVTQLIEKSNPDILKSNCAIADVIARCLRYDREQRVRNAEALIQELETFEFPQLNMRTAENDLNLRTVDKELSQLMKSLAKHQLFSRILALELRQLVCHSQDMRNGMLDVNGDHETIVSALTQYLSVLEKGDQYLTVTVPQFWRGGNLGINGRYLTMNRLLAEKGIKIRRVFLLTREDRSNPEVREILNAHLAMTAGLLDDAVDLRVIPMNRHRRAQAIQNGVHCGIWIQGDRAMKIIPVYDDQGVLRTARLRMADESVSSILEWFAGYENEGVRLTEWLHKTNPVPGKKHRIRQLWRH